MSDLVILASEPKEAWQQGYNQAKAQDADTISRLTADNARLTEERDAVQRVQGAMVRALQADNARLSGEVERLRAALEWYAKTFCEIGDCGAMSDDECSGCRARRALKEQ